jgi:CRISPR type III-B/RAMP module-associated protein Cmr3
MSWVSFTPRDTVFVRDGRSFDAATDALADTVLPGPTTVAGALGAVLGAEPAAVRGPVLARASRGRWVPYFPVPADLVQASGGRVFRLRPELSAGATDLGGVPAWLTAPRGEFEPLAGWIPAEVLEGYLSGEVPAERGTSLPAFRCENPLLPERRVGLAREGRQVKEGYLFQATHLRPEDGWSFLADYDPGERTGALVEKPTSFGGKGRLADVGAADASWPRPPTASRNVLVYLATPAIWPDGWRLPVPDGAELVAAATGEPQPAATVRRGSEWKNSRVLRWAVPAGSVYLLRFPDDAAGAAWAAEWHGRAYLASEERLRTAGFGVVLTGVWVE